MESTQENQEQKSVLFNKPSLLVRIQSMLIDTLIIVATMLLFTQILILINIDSPEIRVLFFALIILYEPILVSFDRTIGQRFMGLRVRSHSEWTNGNEKGNIPFVFSLVRFTTKVSLGWLSLLTIHLDPYGRAIHDRIGDSMMVKEL